MLQEDESIKKWFVDFVKWNWQFFYGSKWNIERWDNLIEYLSKHFRLSEMDLSKTIDDSMNADEDISILEKPEIVSSGFFRWVLIEWVS